MATPQPFNAAHKIAVRNPRTGRDDYELTPPTEAELTARCQSLRAAQPAWWAAGIEARCAVMRRFADALEAHREAIVTALAIDTGRTVIAAGELASAARNIRRWCERAPGVLGTEEFQSKMVPTLRVGHQLVPYPLVGVISPWNFPLALSLIDGVPALIAGCAVLIKPSEVTPRFAEPLRAAIRAVPELAAVFDIAAGGRDTGVQLVAKVDAICFTGSVATGRKVGVAAAEHFIPAFLELGGKDPAIVLASADAARAAGLVLRAAVQATGQACQSLERVYVARPLYEQFVAELVTQAQAVELNYPDIHRGHLGPLIFARQAEIIAAHLADARAKGARVLSGGAIEQHGGGAWLRPTVLVDVDHGMRVMNEETFGPVIPVMPYDDVDEAVRLANDSEFGLSAAVLGAEPEALAVAARLQVGAVSINDGGLTTEAFDAEKSAFRYSGLGASRMGASGLTRFLRKRAVLIQRGSAKTLADYEESRAKR